MADIVDVANDWRELEMELRMKNRNRGLVLPHTGLCHNCEAMVDPPKLFCNSACAEEYEWINERGR